MDAEPLRERHLRVLTAFILRARRVVAHSLASDDDKLNALIHPEMKGVFIPETDEYVEQVNLPDEEQVESAAARLRPLLLSKELTYHAKVVKALLFIANERQTTESNIRSLRALGQAWFATDPNKRKEPVLWAVSVKDGDAPEQTMTDVELAFHWIYGDVVHAEPHRRELSEAFGVQSRYEAAVPIVANYIGLTIETLDIVKSMHGAGWLPELDAAFEEQIVAETEFERRAKTRSRQLVPGESVTIPPIGQQLDDSWQRIDEIPHIREAMRRAETDDGDCP